MIPFRIKLAVRHVHQRDNVEERGVDAAKVPSIATSSLATILLSTPYIMTSLPFDSCLAKLRIISAQTSYHSWPSEESVRNTTSVFLYLPQNLMH